jgi:hypothetical protein
MACPCGPKGFGCLLSDPHLPHEYRALVSSLYMQVMSIGASNRCMASVSAVTGLLTSFETIDWEAYQ